MATLRPVVASRPSESLNGDREELVGGEFRTLVYDGIGTLANFPVLDPSDKRSVRGKAWGKHEK